MSMIARTLPSAVTPRAPENPPAWHTPGRRIFVRSGVVATRPRNPLPIKLYYGTVRSFGGCEPEASRLPRIGISRLALTRPHPRHSLTVRAGFWSVNFWEANPGQS